MKKVLKQQASELEHYVKAKHTQEECIGFIDGFERANELFVLYNVSQQREMLKAYTKWLNDKIRDEDDLNELIDNYLEAINYTYCCEELCDKCSKENHLQKLTDQAQDLGLGYD